jgi:N-methylhydantoinase B
MQVTVTNRDGTFTVDFTGSAPATTGPVNMPYGATIAMCKVVLKALTSPTQPSNAGTTVPLEVRADPGSLFHAVYPAPTFTLWTGIVALELIYKALAVGMPDRLAASSGGDVPGFMMVGTHPDTGEFFALSNNEVVGWGAAPDHDGVDATIHLSESIVRNTPIEVMEDRTGMRFERLEILADSGGAGRYRGGCGVRRDIVFTCDGEFLSVIKKTKSSPWALAGGREPAPNTVIAFPGTDRERRISTERLVVRTGDRIRLLTAGGGGHGDPNLRDHDAILHDLAEGYITPTAAQEQYGYVQR